MAARNEAKGGTGARRGAEPPPLASTASLSHLMTVRCVRAIMSAMSTLGRCDAVHQRALRLVVHRQPDEHVVSPWDAVRHYTTGFFPGGH